MLCDTCGTKCASSVQGHEGSVHMLHYRCNVCDMHKITFKHGSEEDSVPRVLRTIEYIRKALEGDRWKVGPIKQPTDVGDDVCP